jgi:hypothetical protein
LTWQCNAWRIRSKPGENGNKPGEVGGEDGSKLEGRMGLRESRLEKSLQLEWCLQKAGRLMR